MSVDKNDDMQFQLHVQLHFADNNVNEPTVTAMHISEFHVVVLHRYINDSLQIDKNILWNT